MAVGMWCYLETVCVCTALVGPPACAQMGPKQRSQGVVRPGGRDINKQK